MTVRHIPVVMYHGVGPEIPGWIWGDLVTPAALFEAQLALLSARGYRAIDLDAYADRVAAGVAGDQAEVVLTFDDGYLDNWVYAYPLLEKAGFCGTIYVNPEFVDPGDAPRPTLKDVWAGRCRESDLPGPGFLNRAELKLLQESGVMAIASHSMSHTWYPTAADIVDYHRPGLATPWLAWNASPERKHAYLSEDQDGFVPWGTPIHRNGRALGIRRWLPDPAAAEAATALVAANGGAGFFSRPGWREELDRAAAPHRERGRFETDQEQHERYRHEIFDSADWLAGVIGAPVRHFCWPGGAYNEMSWAMAEEAAYRTICLASSDRKGRPSTATPVRRIGCGRVITVRGRTHTTDDPAFLYLQCELERGITGRSLPLKMKKLALAAGIDPRIVPVR